MTAEVAVMNKTAVALATDSAVTVTQNTSGRTNSKVFNTANKLFTLSKYSPVGIMVYNTMQLGGVPLETIIKTYRRHLCEKTFPRVKDYADDFFQFIGDNKILFNEENEYFTASVIVARVFSFINDNSKTKQSLKDNINKEIEKLENEEFDYGMSEKFRASLHLK